MRSDAVSRIGAIILFDAMCVLCSANAKFILTHDKQGYFGLTSAQSPLGIKLCGTYGLDPTNPITLLVIEDGRIRSDSDAVFRILEILGFPWNLVCIFRIIPPGLRDSLYRLIARHRHWLFGRRQECWIVPAEYRRRVF
jgi:predicted DCC family thiol-disulfide oxidoreductase YuxK